VIQNFAPPPKKPDQPPPDPRRAVVIGFIVIALLVLAGLFLTHALRNNSNLQDCVMQGRTNCAGIDANGNPP
jgi:hypothetical protein